MPPDDSKIFSETSEHGARTTRSRDKPSPLCPVQIPDSQDPYRNQMAVLSHSILVSFFFFFFFYIRKELYYILLGTQKKCDEGGIDRLSTSAIRTDLFIIISQQLCHEHHLHRDTTGHGGMVVGTHAGPSHTPLPDVPEPDCEMYIIIVNKLEKQP